MTQTSNEGQCLHPAEIVRIALATEENGKRLYELLEQKATDRKLKIMWQFLKNQEEAHRQIFASMGEALDEYIIYEYAPGEYDAYLNALASSRIFTDEVFAQKVKAWFASEDEALDFAIGIEKDSILMYSAFKQCIKLPKHAIIDAIIHEEEKHLIQLAAIKKQRQPR